MIRSLLTTHLMELEYICRTPHVSSPYAVSHTPFLLCRDGADTPISLNIRTCSKLPNAAFISRITWSRSSSVPDNSLKIGKIICYSDPRKTAKSPISPSSSSSDLLQNWYKCSPSFLHKTTAFWYVHDPN